MSLSRENSKREKRRRESLLAQYSSGCNALCDEGIPLSAVHRKSRDRLTPEKGAVQLQCTANACPRVSSRQHSIASHDSSRSSNCRLSVTDLKKKDFPSRRTRSKQIIDIHALMYFGGLLNILTSGYILKLWLSELNMLEIFKQQLTAINSFQSSEKLGQVQLGEQTKRQLTVRRLSDTRSHYIQGHPPLKMTLPRGQLSIIVQSPRIEFNLKMKIVWKFLVRRFGQKNRRRSRSFKLSQNSIQREAIVVRRKKMMLVSFVVGLETRVQ